MFIEATTAMQLHHINFFYFAHYHKVNWGILCCPGDLFYCFPEKRKTLCGVSYKMLHLVESFWLTTIMTLRSELSLCAYHHYVGLFMRIIYKLICDDLIYNSWIDRWLWGPDGFTCSFSTRRPVNVISTALDSIPATASRSSEQAKLHLDHILLSLDVNRNIDCIITRLEVIILMCETHVGVVHKFMSNIQ